MHFNKNTFAMCQRPENKEIKKKMFYSQKYKPEKYTKKAQDLQLPLMFTIFCNSVSNILNPDAV